MPTENEFSGQMEFKLEPKKQEEFEKIVQEKYGGDLHRALRRAIDYFLMYEKSAALSKVSDTLKEIEGKLSKIREMNSSLADKVKDITQTKESLQSRQAHLNPNHAASNGNSSGSANGAGSGNGNTGANSGNTTSP